ncbi:uncharacterized protein LOC106716208 [Papilio machaon]|uniref:uncharacterized protein LOC106716208 n=1 Tax=Papilio machaon TaxID=76193 RepID=UPI001E663032|nr:uncharacterized protein LOC106716208 [Papilio machaon]
MASSLSPAYLRIAGPSTSHITFTNFTISIQDPQTTMNKDDYIQNYHSLSTNEKDGTNERFSMSHKQWAKFVHWAKKTGFDLVFALNNQIKTSSGMWDPNSALITMSVAEKVKVGDIYWQLGYECANQSIEEYINDLETLRVMVETFPAASASWKVVAGDVAPCLQPDSQSDFKDFVTLSNDMLDAIFLNGNSSAQQLEKMSEMDRVRLLRVLSNSATPLWLTEQVQWRRQLQRAADWLASLGYAARNGFSVHFRELLEEELHEPTLSFYMALIYKNLVGERVLNVNMTASQATLFAHCSSLRQQPVSGAITLYGANMDDEAARFSLKLSKREDGGDIMQFIFGHDSTGNIVVNGRAMYLEGDIRPVVKRVRPYKTLLINLPPKSFGFWVLANTKVEACIYKDVNKELSEDLLVDKENINAKNVIKSRRSLRNKRDIVDLDKSLDVSYEHYPITEFEVNNTMTNLRKQINNLNKELKNFHEYLTNKKEEKELPIRFRRQADYKENLQKINRKGLKSKYFRNERDRFDLKSNFLDKLIAFKNEKLSKINKIRFNRKNVKRSNKVSSAEYDDLNEERGERRRRSVLNDQTLNNMDNSKRIINEKNNLYMSIENEIDSDDNHFPVDDVLNKLKGSLRHLPFKKEKENIDNESEFNELILKTKLSEDGAVINISEKANHGLLRSTFEDLIAILSDFNKQLNRFWSVFTVLE